MEAKPLKNEMEDSNVMCNCDKCIDTKHKFFDGIFFPCVIASAVKFREKEFRSRITERTFEGMNGNKEPITIEEIMDISREVDKIAFEDVMVKEEQI